MIKEVAAWASSERNFIKEEIKWLKAGAKLRSPSGDDITAQRLEQLEGRLEHANRIVETLGKALDVSPPK